MPYKQGMCGFKPRLSHRVSKPSIKAWRVGAAVTSPGPQPGERRFKSGTRHDGPVFYGLGSLPFKQWNGVRVSVGLLRGRLTAGLRPHKPDDGGSSPPRANLAWSNRQDSGLLIRTVEVRVLSREPSYARPYSSMVEHHSVEVGVAGSSPVAVATPWSFMICQGDRVPVVKRTSCQATNLALRVRILPGILR